MGGVRPEGADGIAVVVPCYRVRAKVLGVLAAMPALVERIYCVDDACPEGSGELIEAECADPRVVVLRRSTNGGVGAATMTGYARALTDGMRIIVKLDGDGQMDPERIPDLVTPILGGYADYAKGNRFWRPEDLRGMPVVRLVGNAILSFMNKFSTGYWSVFDPTNGYTAIDAGVLAMLPLDRIARRHFFESDMLFRLGVVRAAVIDVPMPAVYRDETSSIVPHRMILPFLGGHVRNTLKRVAYGYFVRDFSAASIELVLGLVLVGTGTWFGISRWMTSIQSGEEASAGTVMLSALPVIIGVQLLVSFLHADVANVPRIPVHPTLRHRRAPPPLPDG